MNDIIEQYYENFNYPSVDKLYKLLKDDNHNVIYTYPINLMFNIKYVLIL